MDMNNMNNSNKKSFSPAAIHSMCKICSFIPFVTSIVIFLTFFDGIALFYGRKIGFLSAINMILYIFQGNKAIYYSLAALALGIGFIVLCVLQVKNILSSIAFLRAAFSSPILFDEENDKNLGFHAKSTSYNLRVLNDYLGEAIFFNMVYAMGALLISQQSLSFETTNIMFFGLMVFMLCRVLYFVASKYTLRSIIYQIFYTVLFLAASFTLLFYINTPYVEKFFTELFFIGAIGGGYPLITYVHMLYECVAYTVIAMSAVCFIRNATEFVQFNHWGVRDFALKTLYFTVSLPIAKVVVDAINGGKIDYEGIIGGFKLYLPLLLIVGAIYAAIHINEPVEYLKDPELPEQQNDQNGQYSQYTQDQEKEIHTN